MVCNLFLNRYPQQWGHLCRRSCNSRCDRGSCKCLSESSSFSLFRGLLFIVIEYFQYPRVSPVVELRSPVGISDSNLSKLETGIQEVIRSLAGDLVIFSLIDVSWYLIWFILRFLKKPSSCIELLCNFSIAENSFRATFLPSSVQYVSMAFKQKKRYTDPNVITSSTKTAFPAITAASLTPTKLN